MRDDPDLEWVGRSKRSVGEELARVEQHTRSVPDLGGRGLLERALSAHPLPVSLRTLHLLPERRGELGDRDELSVGVPERAPDSGPAFSKRVMEPT